jgi:hypothetical protein
VAVPPVTLSPVQLLVPVPLVLPGTSRILFDAEGRSRALVSARDERSLQRLSGAVDASRLQQNVQSCVSAALGHFAAGNPQAALELLQAETDEHLFKKPPHQLRMNRYLPAIAVGVLLVTVFMVVHVLILMMQSH